MMAGKGAVAGRCGENRLHGLVAAVVRNGFVFGGEGDGGERYNGEDKPGESVHEGSFHCMQIGVRRILCPRAGGITTRVPYTVRRPWDWCSRARFHGNRCDGTWRRHLS